MSEPKRPENQSPNPQDAETWAGDLDPDHAGLEAPERIGPYRILRRVGQGGMGEVYEAEQEHPVRRRVAIKLIKPGMDTREVVARFESERQALALMDHPAIARVFDAGATEQGRPFFAMQFVEGVPITMFCDSNSLTTRERLKLFLRVCAGMQHAHQKGIIHRDIKPSNVLVRLEDGKPQPEIIDFGVAKATGQALTERTMFTGLGRIVGTPEYMSPEQALASGVDVDTRTDVYALGVLLYELLTGELPFNAGELSMMGFADFRRRILEDQPRRPSTRVGGTGSESGAKTSRRGMEPGALARQLRGDLDLITLKALEKEPSRRYGSVSELAADIERHLANEPVLARSPSNVYRVGKFVRRHRLGVAFAVVVFGLLAGYALTLKIQAGRVAAERDLALQEREDARDVERFLIDIFKVSDPGRAQGSEITAREILDGAAERLKRELVNQPHRQARMMQAMANVYRNLGETDKQRELVEEALRLVPDDRSGEPQPVVADNLVLLGHLAVGNREFDVARGHYERALEIRLAALGRDHPDVANSLNDLGNIVWALGDYTEAMRLHGEALDIRERTLGPDNSDTAKSLYNLASLNRIAGHPDRALPLYERALELQRGNLGPDHPDVAAMLNTMADLKAFTGDFAEARRYYESALDIRERVLGPNHRKTGWSLITFALACAREGKHEESERLRARALEIFERNDYLDHPTVLYYEACHAALGGRRARALALLRRVSVIPGFLGKIFSDPNLESLHGDPEFEAIVAEVRVAVEGD